LKNEIYSELAHKVENKKDKNYEIQDLYEILMKMYRTGLGVEGNTGVYSRA